MRWGGSLKVVLNDDWVKVAVYQRYDTYPAEYTVCQYHYVGDSTEYRCAYVRYFENVNRNGSEKFVLPANWILV